MSRQMSVFYLIRKKHIDVVAVRDNRFNNSDLISPAP